MRIRATEGNVTIQVWIELAIGRGHVELKIARSYWGFWPNESSQRKKAKNSMVRIDNNSKHKSAFGGYLGRLKPRLVSEFAGEYFERIWAEAPLHGKKIPFHVFHLTGTQKAYYCVRDFMSERTSRGVEYHILNKGSARNCVGLAIDALKKCGYLKKNFKLPGRAPEPRALKEELLMISVDDPNIKYKIKWLNPPIFT